MNFEVRLFLKEEKDASFVSFKVIKCLKDPMQLRLSLSLKKSEKFFVGCAGWAIPANEKICFPHVGTHLERYSKVFSAVEINSSFYRPHRHQTYAQWATSVPPQFRFAVKIPKAITHIAKLSNIETVWNKFFNEAAGLGEKLGCFLIQLPPSFVFDEHISRMFFELIRQTTCVHIVFEPRHLTWFHPRVEKLLEEFKITRAAVNPALVPAAAEPGGWTQFIYYRLHGSPHMYYSKYSSLFIDQLAQWMKSGPSEANTWCIFDNTALGEAIPNARELQIALKHK